MAAKKRSRVFPKFGLLALPYGVSTSRSSLGKKLPRRTLQRRLARLVEQERLTIEGRSWGSCYRFPKTTGESHVVLSFLALDKSTWRHLYSNLSGRKNRQGGAVRLNYCVMCLSGPMSVPVLATQQFASRPDPFFRLRYRTRIYEFVAAVVQGQMTKREAIRWIARESEERISVEDRARFIEVVETELSSLHEGNIARSRLRPSEFEAWYKNWK